MLRVFNQVKTRSRYKVTKVEFCWRRKKIGDSPFPMAFCPFLPFVNNNIHTCIKIRRGGGGQKGSCNKRRTSEIVVRPYYQQRRRLLQSAMDNPTPDILDSDTGVYREIDNGIPILISHFTFGSICLWTKKKSAYVSNQVFRQKTVHFSFNFRYLGSQGNNSNVFVLKQNTDVFARILVILFAYSSKHVL